MELRRSLDPGSALAELEMLEQMRLEAQEQLERMQRGETPALAAPAGRVKIDPLEKPRLSFRQKALAFGRQAAVALLLVLGMVSVATLMLPPNCSARLWENFFCP